MPLCQWTWIEPEQHNKGTEEEATRGAKGIKDVSLHLENEEARNLIVLPTRTSHQEEHVLNVAKWATLLGTVQGGRSKKVSTSSTTMTTSQSTFRLLPSHETMW